MIICFEYERISQDIFTRLNANGFVYEDKVEQLFCEKCTKYANMTDLI